MLLAARLLLQISSPCTFNLLYQQASRNTYLSHCHCIIELLPSTLELFNKLQVCGAYITTSDLIPFSVVHMYLQNTVLQDDDGNMPASLAKGTKLSFWCPQSSLLTRC